jgi:hypothetical protein
MRFGAIQAAAGGFLLLLAIAVVWLAHRLKLKNHQLRRALAELQRRTKEPTTIVESERPSAPRKFEPTATSGAAATSAPAVTIDAFLWEHLANHKPAPVQVTPSDPHSLPTGMCDRAALQPLLETDQAFTGLVVLVGISNSRTRRPEHPAQPFIEELLGPADFAYRDGDDEFLIVCPGLHGAEAQRRLNEISERLWNFQLRGQGDFSVLFSWGGMGDENEPLSHAIASATERMQQTKRSRVLLFTDSPSHHKRRRAG